jgi:hypothetical protein
MISDGNVLGGDGGTRTIAWFMGTFLLFLLSLLTKGLQASLPQPPLYDEEHIKSGMTFNYYSWMLTEVFQVPKPIKLCREDYGNMYVCLYIYFFIT